MSSTPMFKTKLGLIAATVGSAVGLGAVWRFPNEVQHGGGAAFLVVYILCLVLLGLPVMLAEFSLGRGVRSDAVGDFRKLTPHTPWWLTGAVAVTASYLIACFYMVVAAWTFQYLWGSITGTLYEGVNQGNIDAVMSARQLSVTQGVWEPVFWTLVVLGVNLAILLRGVQAGIEKISNLLMPVLFVFLLVMCCVTLSLPGAGRGVEFFLKPDLSAITPEVCIGALGQAFFTLSLGMGILVTYSAYYPDKTNLAGTSATVAGCTLFVSLLMGLIVFPSVSAFGLQGHDLSGQALVFVTLPEVFMQMPGTRLWSILFFVLLAIAALTSTLSISEVTIKFLQDRRGWSRTKSAVAVFLPMAVISPLCSLSNGPLAEFKIAGMTLFELFDNVTTNYFLPVAAFFTCIYIGWKLPASFMKDQITNRGEVNGPVYPAIRFAIRYVAPLLILCVFAYSMLT